MSIVTNPKAANETVQALVKEFLRTNTITRCEPKGKRGKRKAQLTLQLVNAK